MSNSASQNSDLNSGFGKDFGLFHEVVVAGRKVFADREFWAKLAHHNNLFRQIVRIVKYGWSGISEVKTISVLKKKFGDGTISYEAACLIMGAHNIIGPSQVELAFKTKYSEEQLAQLYTCIPFSWDVLMKARDKGFRLIAGMKFEFYHLAKMTDLTVTVALMKELRWPLHVKGTNLTWYLVHPDIHFGGGSYDSQLDNCHHRFGNNASIAPANVVLYTQSVFQKLYEEKPFDLEIRCGDFLKETTGLRGALRPTIQFKKGRGLYKLETSNDVSQSTVMAVVVHIAA